MQHEEFSLDKEESIQKNIDATGKKWEIVPVRGLALFQLQAQDSRVKIPDSLGGYWTKVAWLQERLSKFITDTWEYQEKQVTKQVRQAEAAKEAAKREKKEAASQEQTETPAIKKPAKVAAKKKA